MKKNITKNLAGNKFIITFAMSNKYTKAVIFNRQSDREAFFMPYRLVNISVQYRRALLVMSAQPLS